MPFRPVTLRGIAVPPPLDVDIDALLNEDADAFPAGSGPRTPTPESLVLLAEEVEQTTRELEYLDTATESPVAGSAELEAAAGEHTGLEAGPVEHTELEAVEAKTAALEATELEAAEIGVVPPASVLDEALTAQVSSAQATPATASAAEEFESAHDGVVSYSEPAIAPTSDRPYRPTPILTVRVPDIPDLDLHVAAALESVAQRIRSGELHLPPVERAGDETSSLALALAALLAPRP